MKNLYLFNLSSIVRIYVEFKILSKSYEYKPQIIRNTIFGQFIKQKEGIYPIKNNILLADYITLEDFKERFKEYQLENNLVWVKPSIEIRFNNDCIHTITRLSDEEILKDLKDLKKKSKCKFIEFK